MKANELRIGNLIRWISTGEIDTVKDILTAGRKHECINNVNISDCEPIPMAEEWLDRFGFESYGHIYTLHFKNGFALNYNTSLKSWFLSIHSTTTTAISDFKYVHQLQNLYFALTGEEIKIINK